ncbi:MerR family transcriptional regulator [Aeromonas sp. AE23HZ002T15]
MQQQNDDKGLYPIREVARLTGVNPITLRAWQRRYGLVQPARTEKGHRLYSEQDIRQIGEILSWLERGVSIGQVKGLLSEPHRPLAGDHWLQTLQQCGEIMLAFNQRKAEAQLQDLLSSYPFELVRERVLQPLQAQLLGLWRERPDGEWLQRYWLGWLQAHFARHLIEQEKGTPICLASWGQVGPLDLLWYAYELINQGYEVQLIGPCDPRGATLLAGRVPDDWRVLLGVGLGKGELAEPWPASCQLFGPLGTLYEPDWLFAHSWSPTLRPLAGPDSGRGERGRQP